MTATSTGLTMHPGTASAALFRFGLFEADLAANTLTRNGVHVRIQEQPFRVLILLLERSGKIVTREELRLRLWPEGTFVDFDGSLNVILKKLRAALGDDSNNPRFIETIPRHGYRFIAPVSVEHRNAASADTVAISPIVIGPAENRYAWLSRRKGLLLSTLAAVVLFSIGPIWLVGHHGRQSLSRPSAPGTPPVAIRKSLAVLGFHNLTGKAEDAWLAPALGEMLSTELASGEKLRLVSGEDVAHLRLTSPWSQTDTLDRETSSRLGNALGGDLLLLGSYTSIGGHGGQLRVDVRLQDAKTGEIVTEVAEIGGPQDLFQIVSRFGSKLRERLGLPALEDSDQAGILAALPLDREAAKFYALGVAKLRKFDALAAKDLLEQATKEEPKFSLGHAMLARAWAQLGYEQKRREEAKRALDLSTDLPRSERMLVEGEYYESVGNPEQAASNFHALFELFPDTVDYGLQLAAEQGLASHGSQALETVRRLRGLPLPSSGDPRIDLVEARVTPDKPASLVLVRSALAKSEAQGNKLLFARARKEECMLLLYGERPEQARPACDEARNIFLAAGNRLDAADALRLVADGIGTAGHYEEAIATYQQALSILQPMGEHQKTGAILNNMAINFENEGKVDRAAELYRQAKLHFEQAGNKANAAVALGNIADILYSKGNLPGAERLYSQALDLIATVDHGEPGYLLYRLADLDLARGNIKDAHRLAQRALDAMPRSRGGYQYRTSATIVLGNALQAEGDLEGARRLYQETLETRRNMGALELVAESQVALASVLVDQSNPSEADSLLRPAIGEFERENGSPAAADAYTLLSRSLLMQDKVNEARNALDRATELTGKTPDAALKLQIEIQRARISSAAALHDSASSTVSRQILREVIANATKLGYYNLECEARMVLNEVELKNDRSLGRSHLTQLASEARSHGLELLARKTEQVAGRQNVLATSKPVH